jgi:hypothetical protein
MNNPQYREPGREHIPLLPKGFFAIRIVQLVLALIIMGLAGYGVLFLNATWTWTRLTTKGVSILPFSGNCYILAVVSPKHHTTAHLTHTRKCSQQSSRPS